MKITKNQLRRIIQEEIAKQIRPSKKLNEMGLAMDSDQHFKLRKDIQFLFNQLFEISEKISNELMEYDIQEEIDELLMNFASEHGINI